MQPYGRGIAAKCSNACGICWSWNSAPRIFILQMQIYLQQLLEIVLPAAVASAHRLPLHEPPEQSPT
jgi:hypothetical protein